MSCPECEDGPESGESVFPYYGFGLGFTKEELESFIFKPDPEHEGYGTFRVCPLCGDGVGFLNTENQNGDQS